MSKDFILVKTSDYGDFKPIDLPNIRVEDDLGDWYRDEKDRKRNVITVSSLTELVELLDKFGSLVLVSKFSGSNSSGKYPIIEIYDYYRE